MWLDKLERKLGKYAISHLMRYIIIGNAIVFVLSLLFPGLPYFLNFVPELVARGQVWRIFTFVLVPSMGNLLLSAFSLFCFYWIGESLERTWGSFKFGVFYFIGWLSLLVCMTVVSLFSESLYFLVAAQTSYLNQSMFIALAALYPELRILLFYFIPLKAKWAGIFSAAIIVYEFIISPFSLKMLILASFIPFLIFFLPPLIHNLKAGSRRKKFQQSANPFGAPGREAFDQSRRAGQGGASQGSFQSQRQAGMGRSSDTSKVTRVAFHRCYVCGITELDNPNMTFRYCSSCNGSYEYCENHIHNHQHVQ